MVLLVVLKMSVQVVDPFSKKGYLHFCRAGVGGCASEFLDDVLLISFVKAIYYLL